MPHDKTYEEKRAHPRYEVTAYVDYSGNEVLIYHRVENISLGGICIRTTSIEEIGTTVDLIISFPELNASIAVQGEVVWVNQEHPMDMGIRYLDLDEEKRQVLRRYITATSK